MSPRVYGFLIAAMALTRPAAAQTSPPAANPAARPCVDSPEHRKLDFWIGDWDVTSATGTPKGPPAQSRIESVEDQCVVQESYRTAGGYAGRSLNAYHPDKKHWEQFWVDNNGAIHHYVGNFKDGNLYYEAEGVRSSGPSSPPAKARMTFFNQGHDQLRQLGEQSTDGGNTWTTTYDLIYRRKQAGPQSAGCPSRADDGTLAGVRAVAEGIIAADNARALERVLDFYAADAVLLPPNEPPVAGKDKIRPRYERLFAGFDPAIVGRLDEVCVSGATAFVRGRNGGRMTARGGGGDRLLDDSYLMLLRRDGQAWRISHLAWHPAATSPGR
jgi:ketosteroid isomerase-like protein